MTIKANKYFLSVSVGLIVFLWSFSGLPRFSGPNFFPLHIAYADTTSTIFTFVSSAESFSFTSGGKSTGAWSSGTGNPAGSLNTNSLGRNNTDTSYWLWTGTWENLGVPSGSTVTQIRLDSGYTKVNTWNIVNSVTIGPYKLRDATSTDQATLWTGRGPTGVDPSWVAISQQADQSVPAFLQASSNAIQLYLERTINLGNNASAQVDLYEDQLTFVITYTPGASDTAPPTPNPPTWSSAPNNTGTSTIAMTVSSSTVEATPPVQYLFSFEPCTTNGGTGGTSSSWAGVVSYTDSGLQANQCYNYSVTARDAVPNTGSPSATSTTLLYTSAATPGTPTIGGATTSTLTITSNDANGNPASTPTTQFAVQASSTDTNWNTFWIAGTSGNVTTSTSASWKSDTTWDNFVVNKLATSTVYGFKVKAQNVDTDETSLSAEGQGTTGTPVVIWQFYNNSSVADGTTLSSTVLSSSNKVESYIESNPTPVNPTAVLSGQKGEWDFVLNPQNSNSTTYYFRVVRSDDTVLEGYARYPALIVSPAGPSNSAPNAPSQDSPANATQNLSTTPVFTMTATDDDADYLQYRVVIYSNSGCSTDLYTYDQTASQTGWSGQNASSSKAYTSGSQATYTTQSALSQNTTYYWKAGAYDPDGSKTWTNSSGCNSFITTSGNFTTDSGSWSVSSNQLVVTPSAGAAVQLHITGQSRSDTMVDYKVKASAVGAGTGNTGAVVRANSGSNRYWLAMADAVNNLHKIGKTVSSAYSNITSAAFTFTANTFYQFRGKVPTGAAPTLESWINGGTALSISDSSHGGAGFIGLAASSTNGTVTFTYDNFAAYTSQTITLNSLPGGGSWSVLTSTSSVISCRTGSTWDLPTYNGQVPIDYDNGGGKIGVWTGSTTCSPAGSPTVTYPASGLATDIFGGDTYSYTASVEGAPGAVTASSTITINATGLISF